MWNLKDTIFGWFGTRDKIEDTNKDIDGKGTHERYNETLGEDFDQELYPLINLLVDNNLLPYRSMTKFIPYLEHRLGIDLKLAEVGIINDYSHDYSADYSGGVDGSTGENILARRIVIANVMNWVRIK